MNLPPTQNELFPELSDGEFSHLQQLIARRADELARDIREKHDDFTLWTRAQAEVLHLHDVCFQAGNGRTHFQPGDNLLTEKVCG